jgi:hypothetical protein
MTTISPAKAGVSVSNILQLDKSKLKIRELTTEEKSRMDELWKSRFRIPDPSVKPDDDPSNIYATVKVKGQVVATLYNSGCSVTSNATYGKVSGLPSMGEDEKLVGPALAQKRAEEIARKLGGTVEKAPTAKNPGEWQPTEMKWTYDYAAMEAAQKERDARFNATQAAVDAGAKTRADTQILGQRDIADRQRADSEAAIRKFLDFQQKTPEEKIRAQILASLGLTEDDVKNMSPEQQQALEEKISAIMKQKMEEERQKQQAEAAVKAQLQQGVAGMNAAAGGKLEELL